MSPERLAQLQDTAQRLSRDGYSAEFRQIEEAILHIREAHATILALQMERSEAIDEVMRLRQQKENLLSAVNAKQAKIDALMLEFCPGEMSASQRNDWANSQRASVPPSDSLALAIRFHETYERLAPSFGYETRHDTRAFDPESKNGQLMVAVCAEIGAAVTKNGLPQGAVSVLKPQGTEETGNDRPAAPFSVEKPARPRGKPCTCDNCLGSSCACRVDAGEKLGDLWYCQKRAAAEKASSLSPAEEDERDWQHAERVFGGTPPDGWDANGSPVRVETPPELCGHDDGSHCDETCAEKVRTFREYHGLPPKRVAPETPATAITPMNCPHCDGIAPRGRLMHAHGCPLSESAQ